MIRRRGSKLAWRAFRTGELPTNRVEAFSDGVIAVVITLLILNVKIPTGLTSDAALWHGIVIVLPTLFAWIVSFAFVLTFWIHHHYFFASLKCTDRGLLWLNGLFLLMIALLPFPLGLMAAYPTFSTPVILLCGAMLFASLTLSAMRFYASFVAMLLNEQVTLAQARRGMWTNLSASSICGLSLVIAFVVPPIAIASQAVLLIVFFFYSANALELKPTSRPK